MENLSCVLQRSDSISPQEQPFLFSMEHLWNCGDKLSKTGYGQYLMKEVQYKCDELYAPECDGGILWNDPSMGVEWPIHVTPILSAKDEKAPLLKDATLNFIYDC